MTWSISASGEKSTVVESVSKATCNPESPEKPSFDRAKQYISDEIAVIPDGDNVTVSASGHGNGINGQASVNISHGPAPTNG